MRMEVSIECTLLVAVTLTATITGLFAQYGAAEDTDENRSKYMMYIISGSSYNRTLIRMELSIECTLLVAATITRLTVHCAAIDIALCKFLS